MQQCFFQTGEVDSQTDLFLFGWCPCLHAHMNSLRITVAFSELGCCFSIEPDSSLANYSVLVHWRVSNPAVITHDRLSEIGPGQAESRDQPLLCLSPPISRMHTTEKRTGSISPRLTMVFLFVMLKAAFTSLC